jgi:hypothetical protein
MDVAAESAANERPTPNHVDKLSMEAFSWNLTDYHGLSITAEGIGIPREFRWVGM